MDDIKDPIPERQQQDTGNHNTGQATTGESYTGPDRFGGTRKGAENVERGNAVQSGPDIERAAGLDEQLDEDLSVNGPAERAPERDERGRI